MLLIFAGVIASLVIGAMPAFKAFGFGFITTEAWSPTREQLRRPGLDLRHPGHHRCIAMLIAVPVGIGVAIFLTELCPRPLRRPIGIAIELAGRHSLHHLRHLGPVRVRALVPGSMCSSR